MSNTCLSNRKASIVPQALAGLGGFFTLLNASWLCLTNLAAVVVTVPILVLVLIPSCIQFGRGVYVSAAILCLVNVALEVLSCLCYGTIYDIISATCFFLAACSCLCLASTLRKGPLLPVSATATTAVSTNSDSTHSILPEPGALPTPHCQLAASVAPSLPAAVGATKGGGEN